MLTWKRFNRRALLLLLHWNQPSYANTILYCRPVKTFVVQGVRYYHVKACDSSGQIRADWPIYSVPCTSLRDTRRRIKC